jgi:hypothetical protein
MMFAADTQAVVALVLVGLVYRLLSEAVSCCSAQRLTLWLRPLFPLSLQADCCDHVVTAAAVPLVKSLVRSLLLLPPAPGEDGTPNESVMDVLARVQQLLSITETQYSGADVAILAPDADVLSVMQVGQAGCWD